MKKRWIIYILLLLSCLNVNAQKRNFSFDLGTSAGYISPGHVPFWLRSNQFGSIPLDNASLSFIGAFDVGGLYYNSVGVLVRLSKSF
jgi:hypothetical protein